MTDGQARNISFKLNLITFLFNFYFTETANACRTSADCPLNAYCEHNTIDSEYGQCVCEENYFIVEEDKVKKCQRIAAKIGDSCTYQEECTIPFSTNAVCINNICVCKEDSHFVPKEKACFKTSRK